MISSSEPLQGSFRDPDGHVYIHKNRVFRGLRGKSAAFLERFVETNFFKDRKNISIVNSWKIDQAKLCEIGFSEETVGKYQLWLEHEKLNFVSYPFEWSFELLRRAAIFHLDLNIEALGSGYQIKDASAYNIQFDGNTPIFIDLPSFELYEEGSPWMAYKQFCEMFLAPLAIQSYNGVSIQPWLQGSIDGIDIVECSSVLPLKSYFNFGLLANIHFQARAAKNISSITKKRSRKEVVIKKENLKLLLQSLRNCIMKLKNKSTGYWQDYEKDNSYNNELISEKEKIVAEFCSKLKGKNLLDIGCNAGQFSLIALEAGVGKVYGIDIDGGALDHAIAKNGLKGNNFFPIKYDFTNPSPNLGWNLVERQSLPERLPKCDGLVCLAVIHHLVIARNIPIKFFVQMLYSFSSIGIVEFVSKEDPMVEGLLSNRDYIFPDYNLQSFIEQMKVYFTVEILESTNKTRSYIKFMA
tara:strand:+ start:499 stop:1899 length:1401 start_codon:yes stop_codon:yes gene_type:complete